ncbi:hypothetical protein PPL_10470 [Heterostelium album PN500]|uniref:NADH dehydrogenase [ubiquinone] 1 beta subcomplex subunit 9 n=1 Tax=Heterostelium pallidum (strain ATCC 26659 / Pp 5 / PN500) TaxID=670386 RepID=D3BR66_HETP5|nr:hypothetical protein PPL_10470 [Heterostelium album PN500]EFA75898.1 hypothetical protein PPL_10470 [Heterostelium album PN500]|eukprot:XP_020428032.1 hypothetical protein PPL_10470 [Heterostelium album PN500]
MSLSHAQKVIRLYRKGLKSIRDYSEDYDWFLTNALQLRNTLKARKNETNPFLIQQHMKDFEKFVNYWEHPDPYIPCDAPGGSKWQRNIPPPKWAVNPKSHLLNED